MIREAPAVTDIPIGSLERGGQPPDHFKSWENQLVDEAGKTEIESDVVSRLAIVQIDGRTFQWATR